jgi:hypothetical protein
MGGRTMSAPFIVFYRHHGEDYSRGFPTMRAAKQFARVTGGRVECRLVNLLDKQDKQFIDDHFKFIHIGN